MDEMYGMSIGVHNLSVVFVLGAIGFNAYKLFGADKVEGYRRFHMLYNPIGLTFLGSVIFTGIIMMAAKHLDFTLANVVMIVISLIFIFLESKRIKTLRYIKNGDPKGFLEYKKFSLKILLVEFIASLLLYVGMLV